MSKECIKFPSIDQFKNVIKQVSNSTRYVGLDSDNNPIFDHTKKLPTLEFTASVKVHGTNASIRLDSDGEYSAQSRERILSLDADNVGFYVYSQQHKDFFLKLLNQYIRDYDSAIIYGEWAGKGIQKGVAVSEIEKTFFIFGIKTIKDDVFEKWHPLNSILNVSELHDHNAFLISEFPTWTIQIDFDNPEMSQNQLVKMCLDVEAECPVGKAFGVSGIGEGVVLTHHSDKYRRLCFKVKGEAHSMSKVKTLAPVDEESFRKAKDFANNFVTTARLEQGISVLSSEKLLDMSDPKNIGAFLKWVSGDVFKEEESNIIANNLDPKKVAKEIQTIARKWFLGRV